MTSAPKNANERMIDRIDAVLATSTRTDRYGTDDLAVLAYIRKQITAAGLERRGEDDQNVNHLLEVANMRLTPYEEAARSNA